MKKFIPVLILLYTVSCSTVKHNNVSLLSKKYSPDELQNDFRILKKVLDADHPSLYWYTPKDSLEYFYTETLNSIRDSMTEFQFKNKVAWFVSKIRCGHTSVRHSEKYLSVPEGKRGPRFPLILKTWQDSLIVTYNFFRNDSILKRGDVITSINGRSNKEIIDSMFGFISSDGYAFNFKNIVTSLNFPVLYRAAFGISDQYTVTYIDSSGQTKSIVLKNYDPLGDTLKVKPIPTLTPPAITKVKRTKKPRQDRLQDKRSLVIDTSLNTAFMNVTTFSRGGGLHHFFKTSFRQMRQQNIQNLVMDMRQNGGGKLETSIYLMKYLADKPIRVADTVSAVTRKISYGKYVQKKWMYWMRMQFSTSKQQDGRYHLAYFERKKFRIKKKNHFDGPVYLVQGGLTFSAASILTSTLQGQKNVTVVGEESGGGGYGTSAMFLPYITLPHTKVRVVLPLFRIVQDHRSPKNGLGVIPDITIDPTSEAIRNGRDLKMEAIRQKIKEANR